MDGYGVLHWRMHQDLYPLVPEKEFMREMPVRAREQYRARFERDEERDGFVETSTSVLQRDREQKARAGFPWVIRALDPLSVFFIRDVAGLALVAHVERIPYLDYREEVRRTTNGEVTIAMKKVEGRPQLRIYTEADGGIGGYGDEDYGADTILKCTLWYRDRFFELVSTLNDLVGTASDSSWLLMASARHPYGEPPFAFAWAEHHITESTMVERYKPALEGVFRLKPAYDKQVALFTGLAERHALPPTYLTEKADGNFPITNSGETLEVDLSSGKLDKLPPGVEIETLDIGPTAATIESLRLLQELYRDAAPRTGAAEITATTQPWAARLAQQQESVGPKALIRQQQYALRKMARSMADVMGLPPERGGFATGVWVYRYDSDQGAFSSEIVGIEPHEVMTLNAAVTIDNVSAAERITNVEFGRAMLNDIKVPLTTHRFVTEYMGLFNASEEIETYEQEMAWEQVKPMLVQQKLAEVYGKRVVIGADGQFVGLGGQPMTPQDALAQNGIMPAANAQGQQPTSTSGVQTQGRMPNLVDNKNRPAQVQEQPPLPG